MPSVSVSPGRGAFRLKGQVLYFRSAGGKSEIPTESGGNEDRHGIHRLDCGWTDQVGLRVRL